MVRAIPDILARIADSKRAALQSILAQRDRLEARAAARTSFRDFRAALTARQPAIIAEIKKASPSKGTFRPFRPGFDCAPICLGRRGRVECVDRRGVLPRLAG